jgi:filamentous hemagglutinin family protein
MTMNRTGSKILHGLLLATSGLVGSTVIASTAAMAGGPSGGSVAVGSATIVNASPTQTVINQASNKALINWNSFSIPGGSSVQFNQPGKKSLTVNRVTGPNASVIDGALQANGNVWLLNANGVLFGKGSQINVGALLATTSDLSDDDFKNGNYTFNPSANADASVVNKGTIVVGPKGSVVLSAPQVSNEGLIQANLGTVVLGGAKAFTVDMTGDNLLRYQITAPVDSAPKSANGSVASALVSNSGTIMAAGGHVVMTARAARNVEDNVINNTGMVEATTVSSHNGVIDLDAGPDGTVNDSGTLDASGSAPGQKGGAVNVTGGTVNVADGAKIDASGSAGGGTVQVGGGLHGEGTLAHAQNTNIGKATIVADATGKGNGGTVAIWSDGNTSFAGAISARGGAQGGNGGQVETSGHVLNVGTTAKVDTSAPLGLTGDWLLDPADLLLTSDTGQQVCSCGTSCVDVATIIANLATTDTVETASNSLTLDINSDITWSSSNSLSLLSEGSLDIHSNIQNSGSGDITLVAGWDGTSGYDGVTVTPSAFTTFGSGAYGNGGASLEIGGGDAAGDVAVGSALGTTTVATSVLNVGAQNGNAQIGYHNLGGGNITVLADGMLQLTTAGTNVAQIGNGGIDVSGNAGGNISIHADTLFVNVTGGIGAIGNIGTGSTSSQAGDITIITQNGLTLETPDTNSDSIAQIGNWSAGATSGSATGSINLTVGGELDLLAFGDGSKTIIGNGGLFATGSDTAGGDITIQAGSLDMVASDDSAFAQARIGNRGNNDVSGDLYIETTDGGMSLTADATDLTSIGHGVGLGTGTSSGNITVISADTLSILANDSGQARIANGLAANSNIIVTAQDDISLTVSGTPGTIVGGAHDGEPAPGQALIGNFGNNLAAAVGGNITVTSTAGGVYLLAQEDGAFVGIGNSAGATSTSGDILISALDGVDGNISLFANATSVSNNDVTYVATVQIGNSALSGTVNGNITIEAGAMLSVTGGEGMADAFSQIGNGGLSDTSTSVAGDISIQAGDIEMFGSGGTQAIGNIGNNAAGSQSGDIEIVSLDDLFMATDVSGGASNVQIGNWSNTPTSGGATGAIDITIAGTLEMQAYGDGSRIVIGDGDRYFSNSGTTGGDIGIQAADISLTAYDDNAGAQARIGNRGGGLTVGNIDVESVDDVFEMNAYDGDLVSIGNGAGVSGSSSGNITIVSASDLDLSSTGSGTTRIAGGNAPNTNINVTADDDITIQVLGGDYSNGKAFIGNFGNGQTNAGGNVTVTSTSGGITLETDMSGGFAGIGNSDGLSATSGNVVVTAADEELGDIVLATEGENSLVRIGNSSPAGTIGGNITVLAGHDLSLDASANGTIVQIGNGSPYDSDYTGGAITGNINVTVFGGLEVEAGQPTAIAQIGNGDPQTSRAGNVSGDIVLNLNGDADFGGSGDVRVWNTAGSGYTATGNLTIISSTDVDVDSGILESALDNENVFLGYTGGDAELDDFFYNTSHTLSIAATGDVDVYGVIQNSGSGAVNIIAGWDGNTTSLSALTNSGVYGNNHGSVILDGGESIFGAAVGSKSGKTTVRGYDVELLAATGGEGSAQIGYNDSGATGAIDVRAVHDIKVLAGDCDCEEEASYAQIGNGGAFVTGSEGGAVNVSAGGNITIAAGGGTFDYAQIGNGGDADSANDGTVGDTGNINVAAGGAITITGGTDYAQIGNGGWGSNTASGNIAVSATGNISLAGGANSPWGYAQIGNGGQYALGTFSGNIAVTTNGTLSVTGGNNGMYAQIGNGGDEHSSQAKASGNISVTAGNLTIAGASSAGSGNEGYAVIGNSAIYNASVSGSGVASGDIAIEVTGATKIQSTDSDADAWIGNGALNGTESGSLTLITGTFDDSADNNGDVGQFLLSDIAGGNVTLGVTSTSSSNTIGGFSYSSSNALTILSAGNLTVTHSIQNSGSGDVTLVAGWKSTVAPTAVLTTAGSYGNGGKTLTIGGSSASGSVSVGSKSGKTNILAGSLVVSAKNGNAQLGYSGPGTGAINVYTLGGVTVQTETDGTVALIGNGGFGATGAIKGDISILAGGDVTVRTNSSSAIAAIGDIGGDGSSQSGNITINSGGQVAVIAQNSTANAQIGNQQVGTSAPTQRGDASGNIAITSKAVLISATGTNTGAAIGNGNTLLRNEDASGNVAVTTGNLTITSSATTSTGTVALLGSRGYSSANSAITVNASGNISLVAGNYGNALIGQGSYGTASGNIAVKSSGSVTLNANGTSSQARIGNAGVNASGNIGVIAASALTIAKSSGSTALIGGSATGGTLTGNVVVTANSVDGIGDSIFADLMGGDFTLNSLGANAIEVDDTGSYSSSHNLVVNSGGDIVFNSSLQNTSSGNITFVSAGDITIGGSDADGGVAVGSRTGTTTIVADSLLLSAVNGYAQLGYHGGGSGAIVATIAGDVTLNGGASTGYYAQIGNGGYQVSGSSSEDILVSAAGSIALNGGAGQEAYAQIGNGGAESNSNSSGYSQTGLITVSGSTVVLQAGNGTGSYSQIGHGGYKSGLSLNGVANLGGNIAVIAAQSIDLTGGGADAYAQIGHGGDLVNNGAANGSSGTISGDIAVAVLAPNVPGQDLLTLTAGSGANSYAQIGNGGQGENTPVTRATVDFTISGDVTVADLLLTGSNTGTNGYAQIGNGDASKTGTGDVSGTVTLGQGTKVTKVPGKAPGASTSFGNATGDGSVSGTVATSGPSAGAQGSVAAITQTSTNPSSFSFSTFTTSPGYVQQLASIDTVNSGKGPTPLEQLSDNSEQEIASDSVADSVGKSLGEGKTIYVSSKTLIPGLLKQIVTLTPNKPQGVPPADVDYSSWGNEALWRW